MNKLLLIFLFLFLFILKSNSQFFGLDYEKSNFYSTLLNFPKDNNYRIMVYDHSYPLRPSSRPIIMVFNSNHQLVKSIGLLRGMCPPNENPPLKVGNRLLWPCTYWDTTSVSNPKYMISVLELDTLYNIIALHKIGGFTDSNAVYQSVGIVALPNRYVVGGFIYDSSSPNYWRTRLYKVDKSFTVLDSNDFNSLFSMQSNFAFSNKIVATTDRLSTPCVLDWHIQKLEIDSNLNIVSCALMNSLLSYTCYNSGTTFNNTAALYQQGKAIALSSTKCLVMGVSTEQCRVAVPYSYDVVVNAILNSNSQTIKTNVLANSFTNTNYPGDWNTPYSIRLPYFVTVSAIGFTNSPSYQPPFFPYYFQQRSKLLVNKTDTMGNIIWSKYFGGEMNYFGRTIAFTSDGGCIIAGTRYDSTTMFLPHISQNFLLKLDAEGNYTSVGIIENGKMKENSVKCYPNPSNQVIYFDIPFESEIEINLYNNLGELVLKKTEYNNMSEIDISQLTQALYNYKIHTKLNFYSGKFLKE